MKAPVIASGFRGPDPSTEEMRKKKVIKEKYLLIALCFIYMILYRWSSNRIMLSCLSGIILEYAYNRIACHYPLNEYIFVIFLFVRHKAKYDEVYCSVSLLNIIL